MPTNRRNFILQTTMAATAVVAAKQSGAVSKLSSWVTETTEKDNTVVLLHTNDIQSNLSSEVGIGGFHHTCECIKGMRNKYRHTILLDAGNNFCGDRRKKGAHDEILRLMSNAGYDAVLPGVKDLKCGAGHYHQQLQKHGIPAVVSNYKISETELNETIQPYKIIRKGNIRIGIIGAGRNLKDHNVHAPIQHSDAVKEITSLATMLKKEKGCQLVVCLSQLGYKNKKALDDLTLGQLSKNVDVIIGGYSCTFMQQPTIVLNSENSEVIINHAGKHGRVLGNIEIAFDDFGNKKMVTFKNHLVGSHKQEWPKQIA